MYLSAKQTPPSQYNQAKMADAAFITENMEMSTESWKLMQAVQNAKMEVLHTMKVVSQATPDYSGSGTKCTSLRHCNQKYQLYLEYNYVKLVNKAGC